MTAAPEFASSSTASLKQSKRSSSWLARSASNAKASIKSISRPASTRDAASSSAGSTAQGPISSALGKVLSRDGSVKSKSKEGGAVSLARQVVLGAVKDDWSVAAHFASEVRG